ncbi:hypothetical protein DIPPA_23264 [Diplonema papillatum]|nr:hypothetical protein DIPPA_23264 [Diplonema papillatum]|eukprot:gene21125-32545_t
MAVRAAFVLLFGGLGPFLRPCGAADCVKQSEWPVEAVAICGVPAYPAHPSASWKEVETRYSAVADALASSGLATSACLAAVNATVCTALVPGCIQTGEALQFCSSRCTEFKRACSAPLHSLRASSPNLREILDCATWRSPFPLCPAFESRRPCLEAVDESAGISALPPSRCASGARSVSIAEAFTPHDVVRTFQDRRFAYFLWPAAVFLAVVGSLFFSSASKMARVKTDAWNSDQRYSWQERMVSIRFCTQISGVLVTTVSCMVIYFLATEQGASHLEACFDYADHSQQQAFNETSVATTTLAELLLVTTAAHARSLTEQYLLVASATLSETIVAVSAAGAYDQKTVLAAGLSSIRSARAAPASPVSFQILYTDDSLKRLVPGDVAHYFFGFNTRTRGEDAHVGFVSYLSDSSRVVMPGAYATNGSESNYAIEAETDPALWSRVTDFSVRWHVVEGTSASWVPPVAQFGQSVLGAAITVFEAARATYTLSDEFLLSALCERLKDAARFASQRVVLVRDDSENTLIASTHGSLVGKDGVLTALTSDDPTTVSVLSDFIASTESSSLSAVPRRSIHTVQDAREDAYFILADSFSNRNLALQVFVFVPVTEVEGTLLEGLALLQDQRDIAIEAVVDSEKSDLRLLILAAAFLVFVSMLLSLLVADGTTTALKTMIGDLQGLATDIEGTDQKTKSRSLSRLLEVRALQQSMKLAVGQLLSYRKMIPSVGLLTNLSGRGSGDAPHDPDNAENQEATLIDTQDRICTVNVTYISRYYMRRTGVKKQKRSRTFKWHYTDPSRATLPSLQRDVRKVLGEPVGEPLDLVAIPPGVSPDGPDDEEFDEREKDEGHEYPLRYSFHLQDYLHLYPDEITLVVKKGSRTNYLAPLVAVASVAGKIGLVIMVIRMYTSSATSGKWLAPILIVVLVVGFSLNIAWSFKLNKKATDRDEHMREWTHYFQTETTLVLILCGFNMQNLLVLWSGLRVGKLLRFHAPMPRRIRNQAVRWSMFSLVFGDLIPMVLTVGFLADTGQWGDSVAALTVGMQTGTILSASIRKFVAICLVDDKRQESEETAFEEHRRAKARNATLNRETLTVMRVQLLPELVDLLTTAGLPSELVTQLLNSFYNTVMNVLHAHNGTVIFFQDGWVEGVFNYPFPTHKHEHLACAAACELMLTAVPEAWDTVLSSTLAPSTGPWLCISIISEKFLKGNLGAHNRRHFHYMSPATTLSRALCGHSPRLATQCIVNDVVYEKVRRQNIAGLDNEYILRLVDFVTVSAKPDPERVYQLLPLARTAEAAKTFLQASPPIFCAVIDGSDALVAAARLKTYLSDARAEGVRDAAAICLHTRLDRRGADAFPSVLCGCGAPTASGGLDADNGNLLDFQFPLDRAASVSSPLLTAQQQRMVQQRGGSVGGFGGGRTKRGPGKRTGPQPPSRTRLGSTVPDSDLQVLLLDDDDSHGGTIRIDTLPLCDDTGFLSDGASSLPDAWLQGRHDDDLQPGSSHSHSGKPLFGSNRTISSHASNKRQSVAAASECGEIVSGDGVAKSRPVPKVGDLVEVRGTLRPDLNEAVGRVQRHQGDSFVVSLNSTGALFAFAAANLYPAPRPRLASPFGRPPALRGNPLVTSQSSACSSPTASVAPGCVSPPLSFPLPLSPCQSGPLAPPRRRVASNINYA